MFQTTVVEKIKPHILCSINVVQKANSVYDIMWKNIVQQEGHISQYSTAQALSMLDN
jgi:hypothetical protein